MIIPRPEDAKHKNQLFRLLREILKNNTLSNNLQFKGGTYASLRGVLDRFSVDLDFDLPDAAKKIEIRKILYGIFKKLSFEIKDESKEFLQFFLRYSAKENERNTLKLEISDDVSPCNKYEKVNLPEIEMYCSGYTLDTLFANKLVAATARFERTGKIAGRDFYDIHKFFIEGIPVNKEVLEERTGSVYTAYLKKLLGFIEKNLSSDELYQDLNPLLPQENLKTSIETLKPELKVLIQDEIARMKG